MTTTAVKICKQFEGFRSKPYLCPAGVWTIGYGTTRYPEGNPVCASDAPITAEDATRLLCADVQRFHAAALSRCPELANTPEMRLGAVVSWVYNLGVGNFKASTMCRRLRERRFEEAANECLRWVYAGGKRLPGLVLRRAVEAAFIARAGG